MTEPSTRSTDHASDTDRFLRGSNVLDQPLPQDVRQALGHLVGRDGVKTLQEWIEIVRKHTGGPSVAIEDLCHADEPTPHRASVNGDTYHLVCFYDAVVLAALVDEAVQIRTESPNGTVITGNALSGESLQIEPPESVFSFGVGIEGPFDDGATPTFDDVYAAVCPYVQAFPTKGAYKAWETEISAATVAMPLAGATHIADALTS